MVQHTLGYFVTGIFCFHKIKPLMPRLALLPFLCISKKTLLTDAFWTITADILTFLFRLCSKTEFIIWICICISSIVDLCVVYYQKNNFCSKFHKTS